jgi:hydroxymethylglutaryl-CoA lyase
VEQDQLKGDRTGVVSDRTEVLIRDVAPRDGLQSETPVSPLLRAQLANALAQAGLRHVEAASFVSPTAVPSMADPDIVFGQLADASVHWWALVPNARGAQAALACGARNLTVAMSASDVYSQKNVRRTTIEAISGLAEIAAVISTQDVVVDVVISCAFGSPFDDVANPGPVIDVVNATLAIIPGVQITLADTTGTATARRIAAVVKELPAAALENLGLHLHDSRGTALANALWAIDHGIRRFDTATGGLGGSPFAPGAGGNLATEDLLVVLDDLGIHTGVDFDQVLRIARTLGDLIGHPVPSRTSAAGQLQKFDER